MMMCVVVFFEIQIIEKFEFGSTTGGADRDRADCTAR